MAGKALKSLNKTGKVSWLSEDLVIVILLTGRYIFTWIYLKMVNPRASRTPDRRSDHWPTGCVLSVWTMFLVRKQLSGQTHPCVVLSKLTK